MRRAYQLQHNAGRCAAAGARDGSRYPGAGGGAVGAASAASRCSRGLQGRMDGLGGQRDGPPRLQHHLPLQLLHECEATRVQPARDSCHCMLRFAGPPWQHRAPPLAAQRRMHSHMLRQAKPAPGTRPVGCLQEISAWTDAAGTVTGLTGLCSAGADGSRPALTVSASSPVPPAGCGHAAAWHAWGAVPCPA